MREDTMRRLIEEAKGGGAGKPVEELRELAQRCREEGERAEAMGKALDELIEFGQGQGLEGFPARLVVDYVGRRLNLDPGETEALGAEIEDMMRRSEADEQRQD
jgi:hypothetical protein